MGLEIRPRTFAKTLRSKCVHPPQRPHAPRFQHLPWPVFCTVSTWHARVSMFAVHTGHFMVIAMGRMFNDCLRNVLMMKILLGQGILTWSQ